MHTATLKHLRRISRCLVSSLPIFCISCVTNPLQERYRAAPNVAKREWRNPSPELLQPSRSSHNSTVERYLSRGYHLVGMGTISARYQIDAENARMLALQKNADVAVFSKNFEGKRSERVAVPVSTTTVSGYATEQASARAGYANSNKYRSQAQGQYQSQSQAGAETTVYTYENKAYDLWSHKTTLLRKNNAVPMP